jgi:hypothetical protein
MELSYSKDLNSNRRIRSLCREVAIEHIHLFPQLDETLEKDGAATKVKAILTDMLASQYPSVVADRDRIELFLRYADHQIVLDQVEAQMIKAAKLAKKAGITYSKAQTMFYAALEKTSATDVDEETSVDRKLGLI